MRKAAMAKLGNPRLLSVIPRRRLFGFLDEQMQHSVVWIEGPPGAGKTTLAASYLESTGRKPKWYQLDSDDGDASTLFYFLSLACKARGRPLPLLTPEYLHDTEGFARRFFRSFYQRLGDGGVLVLDNYQHLREHSPTHRLLAVAFSEIPEGIHVFVISRSSPPPEIARLQANGVLALVPWEELRLRPSESRAIAIARGITDEPTIALLHERAGGWVAGLALMLERLRRGVGRIDHLSATAQDAVFDYFQGEIFQTFTVKERTEILKFSLLPWISIDMSTSLSGDPEAWRTLDRLYRRRLFTDRRSKERSLRLEPTGRNESRRIVERVYQFHDLFKAFLRERFVALFTEQEQRSAMRAATTVLIERELFEEAFGLYVENGAWHECKGLIEAQAYTLLAQGRWETLLRWVAHLPSAVEQHSAWVRYWKGRALMAANYPDARSTLHDAHQQFLDAGDVAGQLVSVAAIIWSLFLEARATEQIRRWISVLDELLSVDPSYPTAGMEIAVLSSLLVATMWNEPSHPRLHSSALRLLALMDSDAGDGEKATAAAFVLQYCKAGAKLAIGDQIVSKVDRLLAQAEMTPLEGASWAVGRACHFYIKGQDSVALEALSAARVLAQEAGLPQVEKHALEFLTYLFAMMHRRAEAEAALRAQEPMLQSGTAVQSANYLLGRTMVAQLSGDLTGAMHAADAARDAAERTGAAFFIVAWNASVAGAYAEGGRFDVARACVARAREVNTGNCYAHLEALMFLDEAYIAHLEGDVPRRQAMLFQSLSTARATDSAFFLRWMLLGLPRLLSIALRASAERDFAESLIRQWEIPPPGPTTDDWPWPLCIRVLGPFEILKDGVIMKYARKTPIRLLELLKLVASRGGTDVPVDYICGQLWPDADGDAAEAAFTNALHRLRKLLGRENAIVLRQSRLSLNETICRIDLCALRALCDEMRREDATSGPDVDRTLDRVERIFRLYRGHLLAEESYPWVSEQRDKVRHGFAESIKILGRELESASHWESAVALYRRAIEIDSLVEPFYLRLMVCLRELGHTAEAEETFRHLRRTLSIVLGLTPSREAHNVFQSLGAAK